MVVHPNAFPVRKNRSRPPMTTTSHFRERTWTKSYLPAVKDSSQANIVIITFYHCVYWPMCLDSFMVAFGFCFCFLSLLVLIYERNRIESSSVFLSADDLYSSSGTSASTYNFVPRYLCYSTYPWDILTWNAHLLKVEVLFCHYKTWPWNREVAFVPV